MPPGGSSVWLRKTTEAAWQWALTKPGRIAWPRPRMVRVAAHEPAGRAGPACTMRPPRTATSAPVITGTPSVIGSRKSPSTRRSISSAIDAFSPGALLAASGPSGRVGVAGGKRHHGVGSAQLLGPHDRGLAVVVLHDNGDGALVLPRHAVAGRIELHAVALHGAADGDVGVEGGLAQRLRIDATVLLDGARQHVGEEDVGVVEAHGEMRGRDAGAARRLPALEHLLGQVADAGLERLGIEQLGRDRI